MSKFALALIEAEQNEVSSEAQVRHRYLSEVSKLPMRESSSVPVVKCIYQRLPYPARNGGLEKAFIEWAQLDSDVVAFCKINEHRHNFVHLRYIKDDGLPAFYSPDFLVRTDTAVYLVETKAQQQVNHPNVQRKLRAATQWCERINQLAPEQRMARSWHYVLLGEASFHEWRDKGARLVELLEFARLRPAASTQSQGQLAL